MLQTSLDWYHAKLDNRVIRTKLTMIEKFELISLIVESSNSLIH